MKGWLWLPAEVSTLRELRELTVQPTFRFAPGRPDRILSNTAPSGHEGRWLEIDVKLVDAIRELASIGASEMVIPLGPVIIDKVRAKWGELGNMAPFPVDYEGKVWPRSEHLFQALRLTCPDLREKIRAIPNPMKAKMTAKKLFSEHPDKMEVTPLSEADVANMKMVLELKLHQNPKVHGVLVSTGDRLIVEDATRRQRGSGLFWGAALQNDGTWKGDNVLGMLWMELRLEFLS